MTLFLYANTFQQTSFHQIQRHSLYHCRVHHARWKTLSRSWKFETSKKAMSRERSVVKAGLQLGKLDNCQSRQLLGKDRGRLCVNFSYLTSKTSKFNDKLRYKMLMCSYHSMGIWKIYCSILSWMFYSSAQSPCSRKMAAAYFLKWSRFKHWHQVEALS